MTIKNSFAIGIPTVNRADLLLPALEKYVWDFPNTDIHVYDNGVQNIPTLIGEKEIQVHGGTGENIGVAASWNFMLHKIYEKHEYAIILNDDVYLGKTEYVTDLIISQNSRHGILLSPMDWCVFLMPRETFERVGEFDEKFFPAYYEDSDMMYRMRLMGLSIMKLPSLIPEVYRSSQTLEKEPERYHMSHHKNRKVYESKWGGPPGQEKFRTAFNIQLDKKKHR